MRSNHSTVRRLLLGAAAAVAATGLLAGCSGAADSDGGSGGELILATYQGVISEAMQEAFYDGFSEESGIKVTQVPADYGRYISTLEEGSPDWNSLEADSWDLLNWADEGWIAPLDEDIPRGDLYPGDVGDYSIGGYGQSFVIVYRASAFDSEPQDWADFWDVEKFPGKRGWPSFYVFTAEAALMADGVAPDALYPLDLDRAFAKLDELRPDMSIYESYAAGAQAFQAGSVDIAMLPIGRAAVFAKEDPDVKIQWNQNIFSMAGQTITAEAPNAEAMQDLARYMSDPERQAKFAELSGFSPVSTEAFQYVSEEALEYLPGTEEHLATAAIVDAEAMQEQNAEYYDRYSTWVATE